MTCPAGLEVLIQVQERLQGRHQGVVQPPQDEGGRDRLPQQDLPRRHPDGEEAAEDQQAVSGPAQVRDAAETLKH